MNRISLLAIVLGALLCGACTDGTMLSPTGPSATPTGNKTPNRPNGIIWGSEDEKRPEAQPEGIIWGS